MVDSIESSLQNRPYALNAVSMGHSVNILFGTMIHHLMIEL